MNPYVILALVIAWGGSLAGTGWVAFGLGQDSEIAGQAKINKAITETRAAAQLGAADEIAKIKVVYTTVRGKTETIVRENVVYRDCRHGPDGVRSINAALAGAIAEPAGGGKLPAADAANR